MDYEEKLKELDSDVDVMAVSGICTLYEKLKRENFLKWIEENPEYWNTLCGQNRKDITPEYAEKVMQALIDSNILELQLLWLFKCKNILDIFGCAVNGEDADEN